jgi:hypothetical protein
MEMSKLLAGLVLALGTTVASADTVLYDTFNEADQANLFDCCNSLPIVGNHAGADRASVAVPFTPEAFAKITEVDVAMSTAGPQFPLSIEIAGSSNGLPGTVKKFWNRTPLAAGQCCEFVVARPGQAVHAAAGGHYWIILEGKKHALAGWNLNSAGLFGPYAVKGEDGIWTMTEGPLPAVRILTK